MTDIREQATKTRQPQYVADAMRALEGMPCGGVVGNAGATLAELEEATERGRFYDADACYHIAQLAWRLLEGGVVEK